MRQRLLNMCEWYTLAIMKVAHVNVYFVLFLISSIMFTIVVIIIVIYVTVRSECYVWGPRKYQKRDTYANNNARVSWGFASTISSFYLSNYSCICLFGLTNPAEEPKDWRKLVFSTIFFSLWVVDEDKQLVKV